MYADTPPWVLLMQSKRLLSVCSEAFWDRESSSHRHNCTLVCDCDFSLLPRGKQEKRSAVYWVVANTAATFLLMWECIAFFLNGIYEGHKRGISRQRRFWNWMGQLPCTASVLTLSAVSRETIWGNYAGEPAGRRERREGSGEREIGRGWLSVYRERDHR